MSPSSIPSGVRAPWSSRAPESPRSRRFGFHSSYPSLLERCNATLSPTLERSDATPSPTLERSEAESKGLHAESGETLVETLITVVLMGLVVVGLLTGLVTVARMVDHNNRVTHVGNTAQSYAEQLKQPVDEIDNMEYQPCGELDPVEYPAFSGVLPGGAGGGYTAVVDQVRFAQSVSGGGADPVTWGTGCPAEDQGLQMLTVVVEVTREGHTISETVPIVKRDARCHYSPEYDNADQGPC